MEYKLISVEPANDNRHKFIALFKQHIKDGADKFKRIKFGVHNSHSYIDGADESVRKAYLARHAKEDRSSPYSRASLSYYITWGDSRSLYNNVRAFKKRFDV
jgi:hypothetical protein